MEEDRNFLGKDEILELANKVNEKSESDNIGIKVSGIYVNGEVGFPLNLFSEDIKRNEGEPKNFDDAYDKACRVLGTKQCSVYEDHGFVWFSGKSH